MLQALRRGGPGGRWIVGRHEHDGVAKAFRLFLPPGERAGLPLLVMLHGCKQQPEDFARGLRMDEHAAREGVAVLYPAQSPEANELSCWNWFRPQHQQRGRGEPAWIASLTERILHEHELDPARVFIAGMSAGGAMAATMAAEYPALYAGVGIHSGLAPRAALGVAQAIQVMKCGPGMAMVMPLPRTRHALLQVPAIVFHGDQDRTVHPHNGRAAIDACIAGHLGVGRPAELHGECPLGRRFTRSVWRDSRGHQVAEHWLVHGAAHAWSGGDPAGSWTDPLGPDASLEMLRFFLSLRGRQPRVADDIGDLVQEGA
ncbi:PHB depolymerase family esterase [Pelomonas sp. KK5]|uniref:extracellular catalytic domain type 1 short-chain-length polyhydroxyalkanoate depolymerase n=1 Tax=Pelomonas sp. KK5 TaxID=1855730 RepID=UPI00097CB4E1|nr:PHB depolymerase family esterase [Pelomonas sp. KK5]